MTDLISVDPENHYNCRVRAGELSDKNLTVLGSTLRDLSKRLPKLGTLLGDDIDVLLDAPSEQRQPILSQIIEFAAHDEASLEPLEAHAGTYIDEHCRPFIRAFNAHDGDKVLIVAGRPYFQILREALALRHRGYLTAIVYLAPVNDDVAETISQSFDIALQLPKNLLMLGSLLNDLDAPLIHVQCWMHNTALPISRFVLENKKDAKVVCEFYDILTVYSNKSAMAQYDPEFTDYTFEIDRFVWTHGDAFIVRAPEEVHEDLRERYRFTSPVIEMHPFPSREFIRYRDDDRYEPGDRPRIVLAGSLMPRNTDGSINWPRYSAGAGTLPAIESILAQGLEVTVFHDPHKPLSDPDFGPYFEIARERGKLHLLNGVPPNKLSERLKEFDFGISLAALDRDALDVRPLHFKTAVGTKLFGYLEAGLPVIVNKENEYIADMVESNGLGFAVHTSEFGEIADRISSFNYPECAQNIKKFNEAHPMDREITRVTALYESLISEA